jgi:hypothetical protein
MSNIKQLKKDLNTYNISYEKLNFNKFTFDFYFKDRNYILFIIDPIKYNEKTIQSSTLYKLKKELDEQGINSLFVFQSDFEKNYDIYLSKILYKFNINTKIIFARKCEVREIPNNEYKDFLIKYHLQGYVAAKIKLGLYYEDELISLMSFSVPRYAKDYEYELARYCSKSGYVITGGASKIFKHFLNNYSCYSMICYSDMMLGDGNFYENLGFIRNKDTGPGFQWYHPNTNKIYNRRGFWKNQLSKKLTNFDEGISAHMNMRNHGYYKIFTLGNNVFTMIARKIHPL